MQIIGCDLHTRQQTIAMLDTQTGEVVEKTLAHEDNKVREFYAGLSEPVRVGIEATGSIPINSQKPVAIRGALKCLVFSTRMPVHHGAVMPAWLAE